MDKQLSKLTSSKDVSVQSPSFASIVPKEDTYGTAFQKVNRNYEQLAGILNSIDLSSETKQTIADLVDNVESLDTLTREHTRNIATLQEDTPVVADLKTKMAQVLENLVELNKLDGNIDGLYSAINGIINDLLLISSRLGIEEELGQYDAGYWFHALTTENDIETKINIIVNAGKALLNKFGEDGTLQFVTESIGFTTDRITYSHVTNRPYYHLRVTEAVDNSQEVKIDSASYSVEHLPTVAIRPIEAVVEDLEDDEGDE